MINKNKFFKLFLKVISLSVIGIGSFILNLDYASASVATNTESTPYNRLISLDTEKTLISIFEDKYTYVFDKKNDISKLPELFLNSGYRYGCEPLDIQHSYWWRKLPTMKLTVYCRSDSKWLVMPTYLTAGEFSNGNIETIHGKRMYPPADKPFLNGVYPFYGVNEPFSTNQVIYEVMDDKKYNYYNKVLTTIKTIKQGNPANYKNIQDNNWLNSDYYPKDKGIGQKPFLILDPQLVHSKYGLTDGTLILLGGTVVKSGQLKDCYLMHYIQVFEPDTKTQFSYILSSVNKITQTSICNNDRIDTDLLIKDIKFVKSYTTTKNKIKS